MAVIRREFHTSSPEETISLGKRLGECLSGGEIIMYKGGLGAGKTTFTRGLALGMGLGDEVSSPTFAIVNEYHKAGRPSLYHFDMYRIIGEEALESTGFFDYISDSAVIAAEWSENIEDILCGSEITVELLHDGGECRRIIITIPDGGDRFCWLSE